MRASAAQLKGNKGFFDALLLRGDGANKDRDGYGLLCKIDASWGQSMVVV